MHTVGRNHEYNYTQNRTTQSSVTCPIIIEKHSNGHNVFLDKNDDAKEKKPKYSLSHETGPCKEKIWVLYAYVTTCSTQVI